MLISNSRKSEIASEYIKEFAASHVQLNYRLSTNQKLPLDALLMHFIENLQQFSTNNSYRKNLTNYLTNSNLNDFLTVLHSIIINPQFIYLRSQALYSLSHAMMNINESHLIIDADFFKTEIIDFYSKKLFDCDKSTELLSLSIINSILFDNFDESKFLLLKYDLPSLLINSDPDLISPLFIPISRILLPAKMKCLYQNGFFNQFVQKLLLLVSSKSIETSSNVMEALILLLQNNPGAQINNFAFLQNDLIQNLYSEDERCIELTLNLMMLVNLPPLCHLSMIYMFVECHWTQISVEAIRLIQYFLKIFDQDNLVNSKNVLLRALYRQPFKVKYLCLMTLLSPSLFPLLNLNEKKYLLESLIIYLNDEDLCEDILKGMVLFFQSLKGPEEQSIFYDVICRENYLLENLLWSENENVVNLSQKILSLIEA